MARAAVVEEFSTITVKGQTTVPKAVRQALGVEAGDRLAFRVDRGAVTVTRAPDVEEDPAIAAFLTFLAEDMKSNPQRLETLSPELSRRIESLIEGVEVDLDAPIEGDVSL